MEPEKTEQPIAAPVEVEIPEQATASTLPAVPKKGAISERTASAQYNRLGKKDEPFILKGIRAFRPLYLIAQDLGVCRQTLYKYIRDKMDISWRDMRESMIDVAEGKLLKNIIDGNQGAIEFFLDRQAKNRGYGIKEITDRNDVPIINIGRIEIAKTDAPPQQPKAPENPPIEAEVVEATEQQTIPKQEE